MTGLGPVTPRVARRFRDTSPILTQVTSEYVGRAGGTIFLTMAEGETLELRTSGSPLPCLLSIVSQTDQLNRNWHQSIVSEGLVLQEGTVIWSVMPRNSEMLAVTSVGHDKRDATTLQYSHWFLAPGPTGAAHSKSLQTVSGQMIQTWLDAGYPVSSNADPLHLFWPSSSTETTRQDAGHSETGLTPCFVRFLALAELACVIGILERPTHGPSRPVVGDAFLTVSTSTAVSLQSIDEGNQND